MSCEQKFYWLSPFLIAWNVIIYYYISEIMTMDLRKDPFPWCCNDEMEKIECGEKLKILSPNVDSVDILKVWLHFATLFSLVVFGIITFNSLSLKMCSRISKRCGSWLTFLYHMVLIGNLGFICSLTSYGEYSLSFAIADIKEHCLITYSNTEQANVWTTWDILKALLYLPVLFHAFALFIELLCTQFHNHREFSKIAKMDPKKTDAATLEDGRSGGSSSSTDGNNLDNGNSKIISEENPALTSMSTSTASTRAASAIGKTNKD